VDTQCEACGAGTWVNRDTEACDRCPPGEADADQNAGTPCVSCAPGLISAAGQTVCSACNGNTFSDAVFADTAVQAVLAEVDAHAVSSGAIAAVHVERDADRVGGRGVDRSVALAELAALDLRDRKGIAVHGARAHGLEVCCRNCSEISTPRRRRSRW
jgi:hypothetical protein